MLSVRFFFFHLLNMSCSHVEQQWFQTGQAWALPRLNSDQLCLLLTTYYTVLWTMGQTHLTVRTTHQSKAQRLGGGTGFFSTHKFTAHATRVICPDNLVALKPPLMWKNTRHSLRWQCSCAEEPGNEVKKGLHNLCMKKFMYKIFLMCYYTPAMIKSVMHIVSV